MIAKAALKVSLRDDMRATDVIIGGKRALGCDYAIGEHMQKEMALRGDPIDEYAVQQLKEFDGKKMKSVANKVLFSCECVAARPLLHSSRH
jgi:hypothetical protein